MIKLSVCLSHHHSGQIVKVFVAESRADANNKGVIPLVSLVLIKGWVLWIFPWLDVEEPDTTSNRTERSEDYWNKFISLCELKLSLHYAWEGLVVRYSDEPTHGSNANRKRRWHDGHALVFHDIHHKPRQNENVDLAQHSDGNIVDSVKVE